ncbi:MAG: branched-chain amino acid ABC transporter substrate-binding protein [Actinobacteria bacterium]|nr:branched-chain amino acid ABC transporter substrate-binding protein [Actinomycetota bacterium]
MSRSIRSSWRLFAVILSLALVSTACGSDDDGGNNADDGDGGGNAKKYSIAYVGPKTGDAANLGINILYGAQLAVKQFNASQSDVKITLKEFDTQGAAAQAPAQLALYKDDASILGIVGPAFSAETKAVIPELQKAGLVMISSSATNADLPNVVNPETIFHRALPDDKAQGAGIAQFLKEKHAGKSVYYIDNGDDYGKPLADGVRAVATANGNPSKGNTSINEKDDLFSAAVNAAQAAKSDVIFYGGYYAAAGKLSKQLSDKGVTATFITGDGSLDPGFLTNAGAGAEGNIVSCPCNLATESSTGALKTFTNDYKAEFTKDPGTYSSEAFDAANILMKGIKAGNTTRPKLLAYVEGLGTYDGISKTIAFEDNGNLKATTVYFFVVKNGKFAPLTNTDEL